AVEDLEVRVPAVAGPGAVEHAASFVRGIVSVAAPEDRVGELAWAAHERDCLGAIALVDQPRESRIAEEDTLQHADGIRHVRLAAHENDGWARGARVVGDHADQLPD